MKVDIRSCSKRRSALRVATNDTPRIKVISRRMIRLLMAELSASARIRFRVDIVDTSEVSKDCKCRSEHHEK